MIDLKKSIFSTKKYQILNYLSPIGKDSFKDEIFNGLNTKQKCISSKYFYNTLGSELFESITSLKEYYPTRTEKKIISSIVKELDIDYRNLTIVELGSGDASKIALFLDQIPTEVLKTINYFPIDISLSAIEKSSNELIEKFELNSVTGVVIDFMNQLDMIPKEGRRLFCFFGSTIGNFKTEEANQFIENLSNTMQKGDSLLLGMDMVKDSSVMEKAYNDIEGVTAKFNLNILTVVNNLIGANFKKTDFEHIAFFNTKFNRIEMHLRANKNIVVKLQYGHEITLKKGETIHTENSHKFTTKNINEFSDYANLSIKNTYTDNKGWFSLVHYIK